MDPFPAQAPHFFVNVAFASLPELPYLLIVEASQLAVANRSVEAYAALRFAVQKLQWVKMACVRAKAIDSELYKQRVDDFLPFDPTGQAEHARAVFEVVGYGKATTDAVSHFLNDRWQLGMKEQTCDLKWQVFRDAASKINPEIQDFLLSHKDWVDKDARTTDSLPATRDEWIHRGVPEIPFTWPPTELGALPIPRSLDLRIGESSPDAILRDFRSTSDFIAMHWTNLLSLVTLALRTAIGEERKISPRLEIAHTADAISFFPTLITEKREWKGMRNGPFTAGGGLLTKGAMDRGNSALTRASTRTPKRRRSACRLGAGYAHRGASKGKSMEEQDVG